MLVMFFGVVEFSSGVAVDRKVTLMARTLSDLTSQSTSVADTDMTNFFAASNAIMTPYSSDADAKARLRNCISIRPRCRQRCSGATVRRRARRREQPTVVDDTRRRWRSATPI